MVDFHKTAAADLWCCGIFSWPIHLVRIFFFYIKYVLREFFFKSFWDLCGRKRHVPRHEEVLNTKVMSCYYHIVTFHTKYEVWWERICTISSLFKLYCIHIKILISCLKFTTSSIFLMITCSPKKFLEFELQSIL